MSTSNKLLKLKRERGTSKTDPMSQKRQRKKLKLKTAKNTTNDEKNETESSLLVDEDIDEEDKQENSLGKLTWNFLKYIKKKGRINININDLVKDLKVKKRRIYDITNVLQGIGYIEKKGKNEISWTKNYKSQNILNSNSNFNSHSLEENFIENYNKLKIELENLKKEDKENEDKLNKYREEFNLLSKRQDFPKYGYITFKDISNLSKNDKLDFLIIKAQKGTVINVIDDEESRKACSKIKTQMENGKIFKNENLLSTLENSHHIFFTNKDEKLKIYRVHDGEISEILKNYNNLVDNNANKNISINNNLTSNNNFINYNEETNINNNIIFKDKEYIEKNKILNVKENTNI